jgi:serine/threonine protein kinase
METTLLQKPKSLKLPLSKINVWDLIPKYSFVKELGVGTYGSVCEAVEVATGKTVAIKKFSDMYKDSVMCKRVLREIEILYSIDHPFIVRPFEMFTQKNGSEVYVVMELAQTDLRRLSKAPVYLDDKQIQLLLYRLLVALNYLHSGGIVHRDIKPGNILINSDCTVKLCDFSISRCITDLNSSYFDPDQAIRKDPLLSVSASSFGSLASVSLHSLSAASLEDMLLAEEENEMAEGSVGDHKLHDYNFEPKHGPGIKNKKAEKTMTTEEKEKVLELKRRRQREALLTKCKETISGFERELTGHIGTRWYRSPEIVLLEKVYSAEVDMWAVGCVFAELLQMMIKNESNYKNRRALFPGASCFPLSPSDRPTSRIAGLPVSPRDQFRTIVSIVGSPSEFDMSFINDKKAEEYARSFPPFRKKNLGELFKSVEPEAIDLLDKLLTFNPYYRITAKEALRHKYFADIRDKSIEKEFKTPISLLVEKQPNDTIMEKAADILRKFT